MHKRAQLQKRQTVYSVGSQCKHTRMIRADWAIAREEARQPMHLVGYERSDRAVAGRVERLWPGRHGARSRLDLRM